MIFEMFELEAVERCCRWCPRTARYRLLVRHRESVSDNNLCLSHTLRTLDELRAKLAEHRPQPVHG